MDRCEVLVCLALCAVWHVGPTLGQSQIDMNVFARLENLEQQVSGQQYQLDGQNKLISDLQTRVTDQESVIAKQQTTLNDQQTMIIKQQKTISEQQDEISKHQSDLNEQHRRLTRLEGILMVFRTGNGNWTDSKMDAGGAKNDDQEKVSDDAYNSRTEPAEADKDQNKLQDRVMTTTTRRLDKRLVLGSGSAVAFHAVNTGARTSHIGIDQKIMFPTVKLNLGTGYHNQHGIFIAPAAGLYIFSTSIMSYSNDHSDITASIMRNGATLARAHGHGDHDQGSVTVVTQLATGDEVWVSDSYVADTSYYGDSYTSFTGCILWPM